MVVAMVTYLCEHAELDQVVGLEVESCVQHDIDSGTVLCQT